MFSFLDANSAKKFGIEMARLYIERNSSTTKSKGKHAASKEKQIMGIVLNKISIYKSQNNLNTYKIAQMGNAFKWELIDAGYDEEHINGLTQWFVVSVKT